MPAVGSPSGRVPIRQPSPPGAHGANSPQPKEAPPRISALINTFFGDEETLISLNDKLNNSSKHSELVEKLIKHTGNEKNLAYQQVANGIVNYFKKALDQNISNDIRKTTILELERQARSLSDLEKLEGARVGTGGAPQVSSSFFGTVLPASPRLNGKSYVSLSPNPIAQERFMLDRDPSEPDSGDSATEQKKSSSSLFSLSKMRSFFGLGKEKDIVSVPGPKKYPGEATGAVEREVSIPAGPSELPEKFPVSTYEWQSISSETRMKQYKDKVKTSYNPTDDTLDVKSDFNTQQEYEEYLIKNYTFFGGLLAQVNKYKKIPDFQKLLDDKRIELPDNIDANSEPKDIIYLILAFLALAQHLHNSSQSLETIQDNLLKLVGVISFKDENGAHLSKLSQEMNVQSNEGAPAGDSILDFSHHVLTVISQQKSKDGQAEHLKTSGTLTHQSKDVAFEITYTPKGTSDAGHTMMNSPSAHPEPSVTPSASTLEPIVLTNQENDIEALEETNEKINKQFTDLEASFQALEQHAAQLDALRKQKDDEEAKRIAQDDTVVKDLEEYKVKQAEAEAEAQAQAKAKEQEIDQLITQLRKDIDAQSEAINETEINAYLAGLEAKQSGELAQAESEISALKKQIANLQIPGLQEDEAPAQPPNRPIPPAPAQPAAPATADGAPPAAPTGEDEDEDIYGPVGEDPADSQANLEELAAAQTKITEFEAQIKTLSSNIASIQALRNRMGELTDVNDNNQSRLIQLNSRFSGIKDSLASAPNGADGPSSPAPPATTTTGGAAAAASETGGGAPAAERGLGEGGGAAAAVGEDLFSTIYAQQTPVTDLQVNLPDGAEEAATTTGGEEEEEEVVGDQGGVSQAPTAASSLQEDGAAATGGAAAAATAEEAPTTTTVRVPQTAAQVASSFPKVLTHTTTSSGALSPEQGVYGQFQGPRVITPKKIFELSPRHVESNRALYAPLSSQAAATSDPVSPGHVVISVPNTRTRYSSSRTQSAAMLTPRNVHGLMDTLRTEANFVMDSQGHMGPGAVENKIMGSLTRMGLFDQDGSNILVKFSNDTGYQTWNSRDSLIEELNHRELKDLIPVLKSLDLQTKVEVKNGFDLINYLDSLSKKTTNRGDGEFSLHNQDLENVLVISDGEVPRNTPSGTRPRPEFPNSASKSSDQVRKTPDVERFSRSFVTKHDDMAGAFSPKGVRYIPQPSGSDRPERQIKSIKDLRTMLRVTNQLGPPHDSRPGAASSLPHKDTWAPHK